MSDYPVHVFDGSWTDYVAPLTAASLNVRDDEIRAIEQALGTYLVPVPPAPPEESIHLTDHLRVRADDAGVEHLYLAHDPDGDHPSAVSIGPEVVDPPPSAAPPRPLGMLYVRDTSISGATPLANADNIVVDSGGDAGISLLFDEVGYGSVFFGADGNDDNARIQFNADTGAFHLGTNHASGSVVLKSGNAAPALTIGPDQAATLHGDATFVGDLNIGAATQANRPLRMERVSDAGVAFKNTAVNGPPIVLDFGSDRAGAGQVLARIYGRWDSNSVTQIAFLSGTVATNKDRGEIVFYTSRTGSSPLDRGRFGDEGGLYFKSVSSDPGVDADYAAIYSKNVSGGISHIFVQADGAGTPIPALSQADGEVVFRSTDVSSGTQTVVHVERFVRRVEELTGKSLMTKTDAA